MSLNAAILITFIYLADIITRILFLSRCNEKGVRLSVRPSFKRKNCDKTEEKSPDFYTIWKIT